MVYSFISIKTFEKVNERFNSKQFADSHIYKAILTIYNISKPETTAI